MTNPLDQQVGGNHYKGFVIQPIEFAMANNLDACQTNVIKYTVRNKGGLQAQLEDCDKAIHYLELRKSFLIAATLAPQGFAEDEASKPRL